MNKAIFIDSKYEHLYEEINCIGKFHNLSKSEVLQALIYSYVGSFEAFCAFQKCSEKIKEIEIKKSL